MRRYTSRTLTTLAPIVAALVISVLLARLTTAGGAGRVCAPKQKLEQKQKNQCISSLTIDGPEAECTPAKWLLHQSSCVVNPNGGVCEEFACDAAVDFTYEKRYLGDYKFMECTNLSGTCWSCITLGTGAAVIPGPHMGIAAIIAYGCDTACDLADIKRFPACCYNECVESGLPVYYGEGTICPY